MFAFPEATLKQVGGCCAILPRCYYLSFLRPGAFLRLGTCYTLSDGQKERAGRLTVPCRANAANRLFPPGLLVLCFCSRHAGEYVEERERW